MVENKQVIFVKVPTTYPVAGEHLQVHTATFDLEQPLTEGQLMLKLLALSVDPYMRGRMRDPSVKSYAPAFELGKPMTGGTVSVVLKSKNPNFKEGDLVFGLGVFEEYSLLSADQAKNFIVNNQPKETGLPLTNYLGVLGMPGMTAYVGLFKYGQPKAGETLYVSAASGAVGQLVGQMGKALGMRVVGSAGTDEKVAYLKEIGFDGAFNYKTSDIDVKLGELCPDGIDVYFENVGGKMLELVLNHANSYARIVACGMISQYNREQPEGVHNLMQIVTKRLRFEGFIVGDPVNADMREPFMKETTKSLLEKKIQYKETVAYGIEKTPEALVDVLQGRNFGKQVVKVADL